MSPRVLQYATRVTVRHACTPRVYTTRVHRGRVTGRGTRLYGIAHTGMKLYMKSTAVCSYEEYGGMPIGRVRLYTYMKSTVVCPYEEYGGMPI